MQFSGPITADARPNAGQGKEMHSLDTTQRLTEVCPNVGQGKEMHSLGPTQQLTEGATYPSGFNYSLLGLKKAVLVSVLTRCTLCLYFPVIIPVREKTLTAS